MVSHLEGQVKAFFTRTAAGLVPADDEARDLLRTIKLGATVGLELSRPRNIRFHRLYWGLCSTIASAIGAQAENVSDVIKLRSGHFTVVATKTERLRLPRSISFSKMSGDEFKAFFERACLVVTEEFLPHMKPGELTKQIEQMVGMEDAA